MNPKCKVIFGALSNGLFFIIETPDPFQLFLMQWLSLIKALKINFPKMKKFSLSPQRARIGNHNAIAIILKREQSRKKQRTDT